MLFCGQKLGKGTAFRYTMIDDGTNSSTLSTSALTTSKFTTGLVTSNVAYISAPTGGMGQFKGLTQGTT